jgi:hypothetical protein
MAKKIPIDWPAAKTAFSQKLIQKLILTLSPESFPVIIFGGCSEANCLKQHCRLVWIKLGISIGADFFGKN